MCDSLFGKNGIWKQTWVRGSSYLLGRYGKNCNTPKNGSLLNKVKRACQLNRRSMDTKMIINQKQVMITNK